MLPILCFGYLYDPRFSNTSTKFVKHSRIAMTTRKKGKKVVYLGDY